MNKLNGFKFTNYLFTTRCNWSNLKENVLDISFTIENNENIWDRNFNVTINSEGKIIQNSALTSTRDNIDYYITMVENLKRIKTFCETKGKELFIKVEKISNETNQIYDELYFQENNQIEKLKEEYNYYDTCNEYFKLQDTLKNFKKRIKLSRKEVTINKLTKQIEEVEKEMDELKNKLDEYEEKENMIKEETMIKDNKEKEIKYNKLKELEKEYKQYL